MSEFHDVAAQSEIPVGSARCFEIEGRRVLVARTTHGVFATDDACPHRGGPLSEGDLEECEIICPWHFWSFDVRDGRHLGGSKFALLTHEVRLDDDRILVKLSPPVEPVWMMK